ncbi:MAG TPA: zinc-ribbon domain-containing protein [Pyrinomonadaceae bacterium]
MIVVCSQCTTRLQLDDAKVPSRPFTVRCPKCQSIIHGQPVANSGGQQSALGVGDTPALDNARFNPPMAAPVFKPDTSGDEEEVKAYGGASPVAPNDLARLLAELLQQGAPTSGKVRSASRLKWEHRRVLLCVVPARRETIARSLVDEKYQVYVAEDTSQAIERMREEKMDIVILESEFDAVEQGAAFVTSEINVLRPAERRRLIFVLLSPTVRTLDTHAAFVHNVNLVINTSEIEHLPRALERTLRDYNDLYNDFNAALNIAAI